MTQRSSPEDFGIGRLFEEIRDAVIVADSKTEAILLWNRGATELFGYETEEALAMPLHRLVAPDLVRLHRTGLARYDETGSGDFVDSGKPVEVRGVKKDGTEFYIELTLSSIEKSGPLAGRAVMAIVRDATDRRAAVKWREAEVRQQAALEIHDTVIQGIVVAKAFFELGENERGLEALSKTLKAAQSLVGDLMKEREKVFGLTAGDFVRTTPASLDPDTSAAE